MNKAKMITLLVALTAAFSFSQERAGSRDNSDIPSYYSTQVEKKKTTDYSCPNGSYVNSYGNTICRPSSSNIGGATAVCKDGTYSYSRNRKGTCSKHGGVARWL